MTTLKLGYTNPLTDTFGAHPTLGVGPVGPARCTVGWFKAAAGPAPSGAA